uniref:Uncharacterized protein n=1 Tax=Chlorocebus sabaeus TaxID=60711 RepID=A0A0D9RKX3_CHLSB
MQSPAGNASRGLPGGPPSTVASGAGRCESGALMHSFGIFLQGLLGVVAFSTLMRMIDRLGRSQRLFILRLEYMGLVLEARGIFPMWINLTFEPVLKDEETFAHEGVTDAELAHLL